METAQSQREPGSEQVSSSFSFTNFFPTIGRKKMLSFALILRQSSKLGLEAKIG